MPVYIGDCKQDLTVISTLVISSDKKECIRCFVLGLCSHSSSSSARLASVLEPREFVSGDCSSNFYPYMCVDFMGMSASLSHVI